MSKCSVRFLQTALDDLEEIVMYIAADSAGSALNVHDKIIEAARKLEDFPNMGVAVSDERLKKLGYRMKIIGNYLLFYKVIDDEVLIMRVVYGARDYPSLFNEK